jgi:hypothetical protein
VNRSPLRPAYACATLSTLFALLPTEPALAHVDVQPRLVEQGRETVLRVELPQLRAGAPPVDLVVEAEGIEALGSNRSGVAGAETRWSVRVRVGPSAPTGEVLLVLRAIFGDGESVEVDSSVVVVPPAAAPADPFPWLPVAGGVSLAVAIAAAVLIRSRRRAC